MPRGEIDLGLARVCRLLCLLEHPAEPISVVHVAGTNGKGSTCAFLAAGLKENEPHEPLGMFTSPHLVEPADAWRLGDRHATAAEHAEYRAGVVQAWNAYKPAIPATLADGAGERKDPTEFEVDLVACLAWFRDNNVRRAILETGVGGRLDATNVSDLPCLTDCKTQRPWMRLEVAVITNIAIDHQTLLGRTVAEIAHHKAGIMRSGRRCIIGRQVDQEALSQLLKDADQQGCLDCTLVVTGVTASDSHLTIDFATGPDAIQGRGSTRLGLPMSKPLKESAFLGYQVDNAGLAALVLHKVFSIEPADLVAKIDKPNLWPGRLDRSVALPLKANDGNASPIPILLDGAHNVDGAQRLRSYLDTQGAHPRTWIIGMSQNKDTHKVLSLLLRPGDRVACVGFTSPKQMPWVACVPPEKLIESVPDFCKVIGTATHIWDVKREWIISTSGPNTGALDVLVAGSLYLVSDVYRWARKA